MSFFQVQDHRIKLFLALGFGLLSISFIITSMFAHWWDTAITRGLYTASASWLGILTYLFFTFLLVWLIIGILRFFGINPPMFSLGILAVLLSIGISIYGFWHADHPGIVDVDITIKNLPESWRGKTVVQISDVHMGHILRQHFLQDIVEKINTVKPEMVFITGDLFDGMDGNLEHLVNPLNNIKAPHGIYYVTGNHETYLGVERTFKSLKETKTHVLKDEIDVVDSLQIIGINYPERGVKKDIVQTIKNMKTFDSKKPSILLYHTPTQIEGVAKMGVSLQLAGHTHEGQLYPFGYITRLIFGPYHYGLHTIGDYSLYTSSGVGTWGPPMRVGTKAEIVVMHLK